LHPKRIKFSVHVSRKCGSHHCPQDALFCTSFPLSKHLLQKSDLSSVNPQNELLGKPLWLRPKGKNSAHGENSPHPTKTCKHPCTHGCMPGNTHTHTHTHTCAETDKHNRPVWMHLESDCTTGTATHTHTHNLRCWLSKNPRQLVIRQDKQSMSDANRRLSAGA